ncbi:MAG: hypothetical protein WB681_06585 [Candidatus Cybelea sp.]
MDRSPFKKNVVRLLLMALGCCCVPLAAPQAVGAQYANRQLVFGPLLLAMEIGYRQWLDGPLGHRPPEPASFKATLDATGDPYTITFVSMPGYTTRGASYSVPASKVVDSSWPAVSGAYVPNYSKGPLSLPGSYVRAYVAALNAHLEYKATLGDAFAYQNSTRSGGAIAVLTGKSNDLLVGFSQVVPAAGAARKIGCYKEQQYLVNPVTFGVTRTRIGCPA